MTEQVNPNDMAGSLAPNQKLSIPPLRPIRLTRRRLISHLSVGLDRPIILVSAAAGFGKTTLLAEWARIVDVHHRVAWLSLDAEDNDPARFMLLVKQALCRINPQWNAALEPCDPSLGLSPSSAIQSLLHCTENVDSAQTVLVLDDYHSIADSWIHTAISFLVEHLPPHLHVVISARADPPLPLARLRARNQLAEIRTSDLTMLPGEATQFLKRVMNLNLPPAETQILYERTEGWVAGLQLFALVLRLQVPEPTPRALAHTISHLTGNHPLIADFLAQEILSRQSPVVQDFMIKTSLLDRLTAPLCDALLGKTGSQTILEYLERANVFLVPLDDERLWYRYHLLFREWLRRRLEQTQPYAILELHRNAAQWYAEHGFVPDAIRQFLDAGDFSAAAMHIEAQADRMFRQSEASNVLAWIDSLPREIVWSRLPLCLAYAAASNATRQVHRSEPYIRQAQRLLQQLIRRRTPSKELHQYRTRLAIIRVRTAMWQGNLREMVRRSKAALALLPTSAPGARVNIGANLVYGHVMAGNIHAARRTLALVERASRTVQTPQLQLETLNARAMVQTCCGELVNAARTCRQALRLADTELGGKLGSYTLVLLGDILREWNDLGSAQDCLLEAIERDRRAGALELHAGQLHLARTLAAQGKVVEALERFEQAEEIMSRRKATQWGTQAAALRARLMIAQGQLDEAKNWATTSGIDLTSAHIRFPIPGYLPEIEYLTLVRVHLADHTARGDNTGLEMAHRWLNGLERNAERTGRWGSLIEILALGALLYEAVDQPARSLRALTQALSWAAPQKYVRLFLDEGAPMLALLTRLVERTDNSYARRLITSYPLDNAQDRMVHAASPESLTPHQVAVLRLIAHGLSNQAIADQLHVSLNTIRTHTQHLFQKLDVHNRTAAVDAARRQGWL